MPLFLAEATVSTPFLVFAWLAIGAAAIQEDDTAETALARADHEMYRRKAAA